MAKFGSFFRRLFTSLVSEENDSPIFPSTQSRKSIVIISPSTPPLFPNKCSTHGSRSCSTSPRVAYRTVTKQATLQMESHRYPSTKPKSSNRRLSAPLIIHTSIHHSPRSSGGPVAASALDESDEDALISPLQRLSLSSTTGSTSTHPTYSINSRGTSAAGSANASPRTDMHLPLMNLSPSNSIHLPSSSLNTISTASGRFDGFDFLHPLLLLLLLFILHELNCSNEKENHDRSNKPTE